MGTLLPEAHSICSNDYTALGIMESRKVDSGNPRILSLLATMLEKSVEENERLLESSQTKDVITIFHGVRAPSLSVVRYIDRIFKYSCCSPSCFVIAHTYIDRFIRRTNLLLTSLNIHRLLITGVMVAAKFTDDSFFNNGYYARVGGVSTREMNKLELNFLFTLDFRLYVSVQTFDMYCSVYKREASGGLVERSIKACGVEERLTDKDNPTRAQSVAR